MFPMMSTTTSPAGLTSIPVTSVGTPGAIANPRLIFASKRRFESTLR